MTVACDIRRLGKRRTLWLTYLITFVPLVLAHPASLLQGRLWSYMVGVLKEMERGAKRPQREKILIYFSLESNKGKLL